jgi:hypothetical protein
VAITRCWPPLAATGEVLHARMRGGDAGSACGAGSLVRETVSRVRDAGARGALTIRADSAFYSRAFVAACRAHDTRFSVTVKMLPPIRAAIEAIPEADWVPIPYWLAGGADVAETTYTAFKGTPDEVELRLIVRRVRPTPGSQLALDVVFHYHPVATDRDGTMLWLESDHRGHAGVELTIRDVKAGGLAHVPSGKFTANAAWLGLACLAHNLARWTLRAAGTPWAEATMPTFRKRLAAMPARLVHSGRQLRLRAPTNWQWRDAFEGAMTAIGGLAAPT